MNIDLSRDTLIDANALFWGQMLSMTLIPIANTGSFFVRDGDLRGIVQFSGAFGGYVTVRMEMGLARFATAAMLMQPIEAVAELDVLDAIKEITNMIAGTLKSSLPKPCLMALPRSAVQQGRFCKTTAETFLLTAEFLHPEGHMMICVCGQDPATEEAPTANTGASEIEADRND